MSDTQQIKPLNSVERRELNKLIDQEFEMIAISVNEMAAKEREERLAQLDEVNANVKDKVREAEDAIEAMEREFREQFKEFVRKQEDAYGLRFKTTGYASTIRKAVNIERVTVLEPEAVEAQRVAINTEVKNKQQAAKRVLQRQALDLKRKVTLTGLTSPEAQEFVNEIPSAEEIFATAMELEASDG